MPDGGGRLQLQGIVPIILTPFDDALRIDWRSLERYLESALADGIAGCIVPAVASEVDRLTVSERQDLIRAVASVAASRIAVFAGASSDDLDETLEVVETARAARCAGVLCRVPDRLRDDERAIMDHFSRIADGGAPLIMLQDLSFDGPGLRPEFLAELFGAIPAIRSMKIETVAPGPKYTRLRQLTGGRLHLCCGWALTQMIEALDRGVDAFTPTAIHLPFVRVHQLYREGRRDEAMQLFHRALPALAWSHQHFDISLQFLKRYSHRKGLLSTYNVRPPRLSYDVFHERIGDELIDDLLLLEARVMEAGA
jgi:dihydrodipicolinate synthase/N-acetylneuraminate lyase